MKATRTIAAAGVAVLALAPAVEADPGGHRGGSFRSGGGGFHGGGPSMHGRAPSFDGRFRGHHAFPRHFTVFSTVIAPPIVFYSPPLVSATPAYPAYPAYPAVPYASQSPYVPPLTYDVSIFGAPAAPPLPPVPRVVEFPTGRYELRGDGIQTPYTWVWIPNPPTAPPTQPLPGAPAAAGPAALTPRPEVYEWVDEQGVVHWTNRRETVPPRYRPSGQPTS